MAESADRVRRHRIKQAGYELKPCPDGSSAEEVAAWCNGLWKRYGELMPEPKWNKAFAK